LVKHISKVEFKNRGYTVLYGSSCQECNFKEIAKIKTKLERRKKREKY